jgi:ketosteroid isomerase-like protein
VPRGLSAAEDLVRRFYDAFAAEDLEALVATLHPDVELVTARGPRYGHDGARVWATRAPEGDLEQRVVLDGVRVHGDRAVALFRRQWWWRDQDELAEEEELASLFEFRDGLIGRVVTAEDRAAALASAGIEV